MSTVIDPNDGERRPDIDLVDGRTYGAPGLHGALHWMRRHEPFYHDRKNDPWAVTRYADIMAISKSRAGLGSSEFAAPYGRVLSARRPVR